MVKAYAYIAEITENVILRDSIFICDAGGNRAEVQVKKDISPRFCAGGMD